MFAKGPGGRVGKAYSFRAWVLDTKTPLAPPPFFMFTLNIRILNSLTKAQKENIHWKSAIYINPAFSFYKSQGKQNN